MAGVVTPKSSHHHGGIEKGFHSLSPISSRVRRSRCWSIRSGIEVFTRGPGAIHPNAALLLQARSDAHRLEDSAVRVALDFDRIARTDTEGLADGLGQDQAAGFVNRCSETQSIMNSSKATGYSAIDDAPFGAGLRTLEKRPQGAAVRGPLVPQVPSEVLPY